MNSASPVAPIAALTNRKKSLPRNSSQPVRQLLGRHDQRRTIASPSADQHRPLASDETIAAVFLDERHHSTDVSPSDDAALDDNPDHGRAIPAASNSALDDNPENLFTHWHPGVPATAAAATPAAVEPGANSC